MDPTTSTSQNTPDPKASVNGVSRTQPPTATIENIPVEKPTQPPTKTPSTATMISVSKEAGPAVMVQESAEENDEDEEIQVASQETKTQVVQQPGATDEAELAEQPTAEAGSMPVEVEPLVEKTPDLETPIIPEVVKQAGVTHSGPGIIPDTIQVEENAFGVKTLPVPYGQASLEEKQTKFKDSKHWLMGTIMYVWRKINPNLGKKGGNKNGEIRSEK